MSKIFGERRLDTSRDIMVTENELKSAKFDLHQLAHKTSVNMIWQIQDPKQTAHGVGTHELLEARVTTGIRFTDSELAEKLNSRHFSECFVR